LPISTFSGVTISNNSADFDGGGVFMAGADVDFIESTVAGNTAGNLGGGLYVRAAFSGTVNITESTVSGNIASTGGGIYVVEDAVNIANSTVSDNTATDDVAGVYVEASVDLSAHAFLTHVTIAGNNVADDTPDGGEVAGLYLS